MHFYYSRNNQKVHKLVKTPLFHDLIDYLIQHPKVILRELKVYFPDKHFDRMLEEAIQQGLIRRENRRYTIGFSIREAATISAEEKTLLNDFYRYCMGHGKSYYLSNLVHLWDIWSQEAQYFWGSDASFKIFEKREITNGKLSLFHFSEMNQYDNNLPDYIALLRDDEEMPQALKYLESLLGDVNLDYLLEQLRFIMKKIKNGKGEQVRESIFLDALIQTKVVTPDKMQISYLEMSEEKMEIAEKFSPWLLSQDLLRMPEKKCDYFSYLAEKLEDSDAHYYKFLK